MAININFCRKKTHKINGLILWIKHEYGHPETNRSPYKPIIMYHQWR